MAVVSSVELARTFENELGSPPRAIRRWVCTLSDNTLQNNPTDSTAIISNLGISEWATPHPDHTALLLRKVSVNERFGDSPYHVEAIVEYGPIQPNELLVPLSRTPEWSFESQPGEVPALFYYDDSNVLRPLTNSAYDYFEGLTTQEAMVRATLKKNFSAFPTSQVSATNSVNDASYFGGPMHTWKVAGVNATYVTEMFNYTLYSYWSATCELMYRQTGWNLQLPDVGWNYISGGVKRRAMVFDFQNSEWVASANPVALDGSGEQAAGAPAVMNRRVNPEASFASLFGTPPP